MAWGILDNINKGFNDTADFLKDTWQNTTGEKQADSLKKQVENSKAQGVDNTQALMLTAAEQADKRKRIQTQLEEMIRLRQQAPGRSQTLLTSQLTPSSTNNQTLLTSNSLTGK